MKKILIISTFLIPLLGFSSCSSNSRTEQTQSVNDSNYMDKSDSFWKSRLNDEQYYVLREKGTEKPFTGKFLFHKDSGNYTCGACGYALFSSDRKFDAHCGWPSFDEEISGGRIIQKRDRSHGMDRIEIMCARCGGHLGHLFDDGPTSTGKRYCVNSLSLSFEPYKQMRSDTLVIGGGCFWCTEAIYERLSGVQSVHSGYAGGSIPSPTYEIVSSGKSGYAEVIEVVFNPDSISLYDLYKIFFSTHNPTTLNRQGADVGTQYRSAIFYRNIEQKETASKIIKELDSAEVFDSPIVTSLEEYTKFYPAEISHQDYYKLNPDKGYCRAVILPKVEKFEKVFKKYLKK